jgi:hypothetical protein
MIHRFAGCKARSCARETCKTYKAEMKGRPFLWHTELFCKQTKELAGRDLA